MYMYMCALLGCHVTCFLLQVFPDKAQYPDDKEWENEWDDGKHSFSSLTRSC